jgi:hypothetical protein
MKGAKIQLYEVSQLTLFGIWLKFVFVYFNALPFTSLYLLTFILTFQEQLTPMRLLICYETYKNQNL